MTYPPQHPSYPGPPGSHGAQQLYRGQPYPGQPYPPPYPRQPPRGKRTGLVVGLIVTLVVLIAGGSAIGAYFFFFRGDDNDDARTVAQNTANAMTHHDVAALRELACDADMVNVSDVMPGGEVGLWVELAGEAQVDGSTARVPMKVTFDYSQEPEAAEAGMPPTMSFDGFMQLNKRDDGWCTDLTQPINPEVSR